MPDMSTVNPGLTSFASHVAPLLGFTAIAFSSQKEKSKAKSNILVISGGVIGQANINASESVRR